MKIKHDFAYKIQIKNHYRLLKILITFETLNFYNYEIFTH